MYGGVKACGGTRGLGSKLKEWGRGRAGGRAIVRYNTKCAQTCVVGRGWGKWVVRGKNTM